VAELKKELETEGKEETDEPEAERDGLSGWDDDGEGWWVWRVRIVSVLVLIDPASIAVRDNDKMGGGVGMERLDCGGVDTSQICLISCELELLVCLNSMSYNISLPKLTFILISLV
jgi:hypothetical protein